MSAYDAMILQSRRLTILRALAEQPSGAMNERDLLDHLDLFGHRVARADVRDLLDWLEAAGAVRLSRPVETLVVAEITRRGQDHVERRALIEGVAAPSRA